MTETYRFDERLLSIIVCPLTKTPLRYDKERQELVSDEAQLAFPIRDGIPILLVDEARPLNDNTSGDNTTGDKTTTHKAGEP